MVSKSLRPQEIEELLKIIHDDPLYYYRTIKRLYPDFYAEMNAGNLPLAEAMYCQLFNNGELVYCACGKTPKFINITIGYRLHCSPKCAANDTHVQQKRETTNLKRFGVSNSRQCQAVQQKFEATMQARYGAPFPLQNAELKTKAQNSHARHDQQQIVQKRQRTNMERFGVAHASQNSSVKHKRATTCLQRYGIDTPLRNRAVIQASVEKRRTSYMDQMVERVTTADALFETFHGVNLDGNRLFYPWRCRQCRQMFEGHLDDGQQPRCPMCFPITLSKGHTEIRDYLNNRGLMMISNDRSIIRPSELDLVNMEHKLAIEYNGLYYHHDRQVGKNYHLDKLVKCQDAGYRLIQIFESEWLFQRPIVESRLASIFGKNARMYARDTRLAVLSSQDAREFLSINHLQGYCPASINLALLYHNIPIAIMTFGKARFSNYHDFELLRYASNLCVNITGGASKLFAGFRKLHPTASVVSYADRRWSTGQLYHALGFNHLHTSTPNYFYSLDKLHLLSRQQFQKHKLASQLTVFDAQLSESENMYANGYLRIWDCGNDVFEFRP